MNNKEYIYILDYLDCTICEIERSTDDERDIEDVLEEYDYNIDSCFWMISDHKIENIITLTPNNFSNI